LKVLTGTPVALSIADKEGTGEPLAGMYLSSNASIRFLFVHCFLLLGEAEADDVSDSESEDIIAE
jgi:hypothetical protein